MYKLHVDVISQCKFVAMSTVLLPRTSKTLFGQINFPVLWIIVHVSRYKKINDENQHLSPMKTSEECRNVLTTWCVGINEILVCFTLADIQLNLSI
jgi:hypothetical protein